MNLSNLFKHFKKRLRKARRSSLALGAIAVVIVATAALTLLVTHSSDHNEAVSTFAPTEEQLAHRKARENIIEALSKSELKHEVVWNKKYVCGKETLSLGLKSSEDIMKLLMEQPQVSAQLDAQGSVILQESIDDLSPHCKDHAYIGVDDQGKLMMYETGMGTEDRKTLRTFFQLDIQQMESSLPHETVKQLYSGIKISDVDEYNSVISSFSDYAVEKSQKVLKSTL